MIIDLFPVELPYYKIVADSGKVTLDEVTTKKPFWTCSPFCLRAASSPVPSSHPQIRSRYIQDSMIGAGHHANLPLK